MTEPAQGEVWWGEAPDQKGRPYLVLTRDEAIPVLRTVLVAPVTRTVRGIPTEIPLGSGEGLPAEGVATFDNVQPFPKSMLVRRLGTLAPKRRSEPSEALRATLDC
ncbi:MAG TPA: type II toxin-antitoxin system PemK/MazF family toxin [Actinomycetota bacterium]|nr:type II toxin-antitoxin system PemK/MazF family toxin [Actinomycetota bacterium]